MNPDKVTAATRAWIERAVIGLNLCPFAKAVYVRDQIRYTVSAAESPDALLGDLRREARWLAEVDPLEIDTTLIIHPNVLTDFLEYNDFLGDAEEEVARLGLEGVLQVASFHPQYQFADADAADIVNYTNRSPYPMLHLLREESVDRAVAAYPDVEQIYLKNIETMRRLGIPGWKALGLETPE